MNLPLSYLIFILAALGVVGALLVCKRIWHRKSILRAAEQGDPQAQYEAALLCYHGKSTAKDWPRAFSYMHAAAQAGHIKATNALGALYCAGHGTEKNIEKAFACYQKTAGQNDFEGMLNLAALYRSQKDDTQTFAWVKKAADGKSPLGQRLLAEFYQEGIGTEKDDKQALKYYTLAARQGEPAAVQFLKNRTPSLQRRNI